MKRHFIVAITLVIFTLALATVAMAADPFVGTWKLNVAKSKYNPGPAPKSVTLKIEDLENGFKWTFDTIEADGKATHVEWSGKHDGKDYSFAGNPDADTAATKKTDANTLTSVLKKGGKALGSGRILASKDGKTLTLTEKGTNPQGQDVNNTIIYDKQ